MRFVAALYKLLVQMDHWFSGYSSPPMVPAKQTAVNRSATIAKTLRLTSIRHQSDEKVVDQCLIDVDMNIFAIWVGIGGNCWFSIQHRACAIYNKTLHNSCPKICMHYCMCFAVVQYVTTDFTHIFQGSFICAVVITLPVKQLWRIS